jgi:hypothetical protein
MTTERRIARPGPFWVTTGGLATFLASLTFVAGEEGAKPAPQAVAQRPVVVKKVIRRVVVTTIRPAAAPASAPAPVHVATRPAAPATPAAAPAAPAPARAPVVTRSS